MKIRKFISIMFLVLSALILVGCEEGETLGEDEVRIRESASVLEGTHYEDVVEQLQTWGFINIETVPVYDIIWGITKEGTTKSVKIGGSVTFKRGDVYQKDVSIIVTYSMKVSSKPEDVKYEIIWKNADGSILRTDQIKEGTTPIYTGIEPELEHTNEKKKYIFNGWTPEITQVTGSKIYTATYLEVDNTFTITFDLNGGSWSLDNTQSVIYNELITDVEPTKEGFSFDGWETQGIIFKSDFDSKTPIQKNYTLIAKWSEFKHTVTFDLDGGTWSLDNIQKVIPNDVITKSTPSKEWGDFLGWLYHGQPFDLNTPITSDITLKANWKLFTVEELLEGGWNCVRGLGCDQNPHVSYIEFDGIFVDINEKRYSGLIDFNYVLRTFSLNDNKLSINLGSGNVEYTLSYSRGRLTFEGSGLYTLNFERADERPNTLNWKWNLLYNYAKTKSVINTDQYGSYYEIEMNMNIRNVSPKSELVESNRQIIRVYQEKLIDIYFYYVGVNDSLVEMTVNIAFDYRNISNNNIGSTYISIEENNHVMVTNQAIIEIEFDQDVNVFFFYTSNVLSHASNFPLSSNLVIINLEYFSETVLFYIAEYFINEHNIYMFTK